MHDIDHRSQDAMQRAARPVALAHPTIIDAHPLRVIDAAIAGGFDGFGLRIVPPGRDDAMVPIIGNEPLIRNLMAKMADSGVSLFDVEVLMIGEDMDLDAFKPALETAGRLGARQVLTVGTDADMSRFDANLARLADLADDYGLGIALEFISFLPVSSLLEAADTVQRVGRPNVGVLFDVLHWARSGGRIADIEAVDPALLAYCQFCDVRGPDPVGADALLAEGVSGRFHPGEGEMPLAAILAILPADLPISVEAPCGLYANLDPVERAVRCGEATRRCLGIS